MFIRPYTISQICLLLLALFLAFYLQSALPRMVPEKRLHTRWMHQAALWVALLVTLHLILGVAEDPRLNLVAYLRDPVGLLIWHALAQAMYAIPPVEPFTRRQETRRITQAVTVLFALEMLYLPYRLWAFSQTGEIRLKHAPMLLPAVIAGVWVMLLVVRKLWVTVADPAASARQRLRQVLSVQPHGIATFYQSILVVVVIQLVMTFAYHRLMGTWNIVPSWLPFVSDATVTISFVLMLFAYLRSPLAATTLELRLMGAGVALFLGLISVLGWLVTLTYLHHQAPTAPPLLVFGNQIQSQFFITPATYRPLAQMLSNLLTPLIWFAIVGTFVFIGLYTSYYRSTLNESLEQIFEGFRQVQQGNLAHRLPVSTWQDELNQVGISFNQMVSSLEEANQALHAYQQHLQLLVDQRTAELGREMELRRRLELRQAVQDERSRIAQETHDGLLQSMMGIRIRLNRGKRISRMDATRIEAEIGELADEVTNAMQELRILLNELNEEILPHGLVAGIEATVARHQQSYPTTIRTDITYTPGSLTLGQELHILRIVQEALSNASRHGGATHAEVVLRLTEPDHGAGALYLQIRDNGFGFDPNRHRDNGWGLHNMQRRAAALGAVLEIHSHPRDADCSGTVVRLRPM